MAASGVDLSVFSTEQMVDSEDNRLYNPRISIAIERCLFCNATRRSFYCTSCLKSGNFDASENRMKKIHKRHITDNDSTAQELILNNSR